MNDIEKILLSDILPIFVTLLLGYLGGRLHKFDNDQMQGLNKVVLSIALPAALFLSITKATRETLFGDLSLTAVSFIVVIGMFLLCILISNKIFKHSLFDAAACGLVVGSPSIGFLGFAVLEPIFGTGTQVGLVVAIVAIIANAIIIPLGLFFMNKGSTSKDGAKPKTSSLDALIAAVKDPLFWVPALAIVIVLAGIRFPAELDPCFDLIAKSNSGIAVFSAGIALSTVKFTLGHETIWNIFYRTLLSPAAALVLGLVFGLHGETLQMFVVSIALPTAFSGFLICVQNNAYVQEGASTVASTSLFFLVTLPLWLTITPMVERLFG